MKAFAIAGFLGRKPEYRDLVHADLMARASPLDYLTIFDSHTHGEFFVSQIKRALRQFKPTGGTYMAPVLDWAEQYPIEELIIYCHGAYTQQEYDLQFPAAWRTDLKPRPIKLKISYVLYEGSFVEPMANVLSTLDGSPVYRWPRPAR